MFFIIMGGLFIVCMVIYAIAETQRMNTLKREDPEEYLREMEKSENYLISTTTRGKGKHQTIYVHKHKL